MAQQAPNDPYRPASESPAWSDPRQTSQFDNELQADPELREGPVTTGRVAAFAVAIMLVFAAVFYGMNSSSTNPGQPVAAGQSVPANQASTPNSGAGVTTGAAPTSQPQSAPTGTEIDRAVPKGSDGNKAP
ncbi:hypothetical protein [Rhodopseudomonas sp. B29]|uniref:hypothetical protein n=1 Tax=Rhodopseudomonas sp. B29 TaxID=95607 RepID=UPI00034CEE88|nr:hypothetical protein [Rhodopseudomonas sp. B29]